MKPAHQGAAFRRAPAAQAAGALPQSAKRQPAPVQGRVKGFRCQFRAKRGSIQYKKCSTQREGPRLRGRAGQVMQETEYSVPPERLAGRLPFQGLCKLPALPGGGADYPPSAGHALFQMPQRCPAAEKVQNAHIPPGAAPFWHILQRACAGKQKAGTHCRSTGAFTKVQSLWRAPAECGIMKAVRRGGGPAPYGRYGRTRHGAARAENRGLCDGTV